MSGLVYRGDTFDNFGELLPCPYIEKVWVQEKGWVVQLSLMINTLSADPDIDLIENNLRALTYYTCPVWDEPSHRILNNILLRQKYNFYYIFLGGCRVSYTHLLSVRFYFQNTFFPILVVYLCR